MPHSSIEPCQSFRSKWSLLMIQTPIQRCNCCGLPVATQSGDNCPRCNYPINASKEKNFLIATIGNLQRVITYGGANMTVPGLVHRYQARLNYLRQLDAAAATAGTGTEQAAPIHGGARVEESGGEGLYGRPPVLPTPEHRSAPQRIFSWRSFFEDQGITILASIGAILILVGSLRFIVTTTNILLAFLVVFIVHALFGIVSAI